MKTLFRITLFAICLSTIYTTGCTRVGAGEAGIKVSMAGNDRGVLNTPAQTGWVFFNPIFSSVTVYPTTVHNFKWTASPSEGSPGNDSITFTNVDGMSINVDVSINVRVQADKIPQFYVKYKSKDLNTFADSFLRNTTRECLNEVGGKTDIDHIMGDKAAFIKDAEKCISKVMEPDGVLVGDLSIIGSPRPPDAVVTAINMKIQANQISMQKEMELKQVTADANKQFAQAEGEAKAAVAKATGEAQANKIKAASITPVILESKRLDIQNAWLYRWNGSVPQTVVMSGGKSDPMVMLPNYSK